MAYLQIPSVFDIKMAEQLGDCARLNACGGKPSIVYQTKTDLVLYSGPNLSCTNIKKCTNTTEIFQNFNAAICPETITETIINAIINNTTLSDLLCDEVIQKCVTCDDFKDCITCDVILECTSTTTSTTTVNPCRCITFSNIGTGDGVVYYDACPGSFASGINLPVGAVVQICGSNPSAGDGDPGFNPTWTIGDPCVKVGQYDVCSDDCCEYTITRNDPGTIYVDFINCFGYYNETLEIQDGDPLPTFCALDGQVFTFGPGTAVKNNCTCIPTCQCYEADTTGGGNFYLRWLSCDGVDKAQSIFNEVYQICATPGTVRYTGTGSFSLTPLLTPCTLDTDCWEEFVMDATNVSGTLTFNQIGATGRYAIEWEPGVFSFYNTPGIFARSYTYSAPYTGPIKIKAPSLSYITRLYIFSPNFSAPSGQGIDIIGSELVKLTNLERLNVGYQVQARIICATTDIPNTLIELRLYKGNLSGDLYDGVNPTLPSTLTSLEVYGTSTVFGDIQYLPPNLTTCIVLGSNNLNGDLANLPASLATTLVTIQIEGSNDITGDIGSFGTYTSLTSIRFLGDNTIDGDIAGISTVTTLESFTIYGKNALSGNLSALTPLTLLERFAVDNNDIVLGPGIGNTLTGALSSLPSSLVIFVVGKFNTIGGNLSDIPPGIVQFVIRQTAGGGGVITGSLASITAIPMIEFSLVGGSHTFSGTILDLPSTLTYIYLDTDGAISGDVADLPTGTTGFTVISGSAGSIFTYTSPRTWAPTMQTMDIYTPGAPGIPTIDDLIIDLANSTWVIITVPSTYGIRLKGTLTNPAAIADAALIAATPTNVVFY